MKLRRLLFAGVVFWMMNGGAAMAQDQPPFGLVGIGSQKILVTLNKMTNLVFPAAIRTGVKVSREVAVQKVKGVENVLELKALRRDFPVTNLSVFGMDGKMYCFDLEYSDNPAVLSFQVVNHAPGIDSSARPGVHPVILSGLPADQSLFSTDADSLAGMSGFLHKSRRSQKIRLQVKGIYLKDGLMWFAIRIRNRSFINYRPEYMRLLMVDRKKVKRTAMQELLVDPTYSNVPPVIAGNGFVEFAVGYPPFTVAKDKRLLLELAEQNGGRLVQLEINYRTVLKARASKLSNEE